MRIMPSFFILLVLLLGATGTIIGIYSGKNPPDTQISSETLKTAVQGVETSRGEVQGVIDGDTLTLTSGEKIRLIGMNTPEKGQPGYEEAKKTLEDLVSKKTIDIQFDTQKLDKYQRTLAYVYVDNLFINKELIQKGVAMVETIPPNVKHSKEFVETQQDARKDCKGMWSGLCNQTASSCVQISAINAVPRGFNTADKNSEWVEIMNTCSENKDLAGYLIKDSSAGNSYAFKATIIKAKQRIKLHSGCNVDLPTDVYWQCPERSSMVWNNLGDHAYLYDAGGKLISEMAY